jgi:hypothetical protein
MSSIYRKGRDGYYYYQTYVFNAESKKKNKRIFHALKTKEISEARIKQIKLDLRYSNKERRFSQKKIKLYFSRIVQITIILIIVFSAVKINNKRKINIIDQSHNDPMGVDKVEILHQNNQPTEQLNLVLEDESKFDSTISENKELAHPRFEIRRIEKFSSVFEQIKLFITIESEFNEESLYGLCKNLRSEYSNFSNLIICLYLGNEIGKNLANGYQNFVSIEDKKKSWLAMYTYNPVEGEYFDSNPTDYLGN